MKAFVLRSFIQLKNVIGVVTGKATHIHLIEQSPKQTIINPLCPVERVLNSGGVGSTPFDDEEIGVDKPDRRLNVWNRANRGEINDHPIVKLAQVLEKFWRCIRRENFIRMHEARPSARRKEHQF